MRSREQLIAECDVILLKPHGPRSGRASHCVQDEELTIDCRQTLIAFESMNLWSRAGSFKLHVFHKNNEIAGYCSVLHAMSIVGWSGIYGRRLWAAVIGFGATARGAVTALNALGVNDIDVLTNRGVTEVASPIHPAPIVHFDQDTHSRGGSPVSFACTQEGSVPLAGYLARHDIIINCVLQDTNAPLILLDGDLAALRPNSLIVDVSCDAAMGFSWARPPRLSGRRSSSDRTSPTMRSTTAPPACGIRRPGRSARRCFSTCQWCLPGVTRGRRIRRCAGRSRSSTGLC